MSTLRKRTRRTRCGLLVVGAAMLALLTTGTLAIQRGAEMKVSVRAKPPKIVAVRVQHDQCPYCRKLKSDPEFRKLSDFAAEGDVLLVTIDLSTEEAQRQSALLIGALGLEAYWPADMSPMGTTTLIDWRTRKAVSSLRAFEAKEIREAMRAALVAMDGDGE